MTIGGLTLTAGTGAIHGVSETNATTGTIVRDSFVHGFTGGLGVAIAAGSTGFAVTGNEVFNNYAGVYLSTGASDGTVNGNVIRNHTVSAGPDAGSGVVFEGVNTDVTITGNAITGNRHGLYVWTGFGSDLSGTTVFDNAIVGTVAGVLNTNTAVLNASGNWWGTATAAGVAATAGTNVDFGPWLAAGTFAYVLLIVAVIAVVLSMAITFWQDAATGSPDWRVTLLSIAGSVLSSHWIDIGVRTVWRHPWLISVLALALALVLIVDDHMDGAYSALWHDLRVDLRKVLEEKIQVERPQEENV